jgi:hypothetical protein
MHQIISWGQSSCRIESLYPFIRESSIQVKNSIQPQKQNKRRYQLLKPAGNIFSTDHKNNTFYGLKASDRVLRTCWLLLLEEYGVTFEYLLGNKYKNVVADALSCFDIDSLKIQEE